jgi:hypothetical protein
MMLPKLTTSIETLVAKQDAHDTVTGLIERNLELEQIFEVLQPLLFEMSVLLYKDNTDTIGLGKLVEDGVNYIKGVQNV